MSPQIVEHPLLNPWQHFTIYATHNVNQSKILLLFFVLNQESILFGLISSVISS